MVLSKDILSFVLGHHLLDDINSFVLLEELKIKNKIAAVLGYIYKEGKHKWMVHRELINICQTGP